MWKPWSGRSAEQRVDEALAAAQIASQGGVITLEQALVLLEEAPSVVQRRLAERPAQLDSTAHGSLLFYEAQKTVRRKYSRKVQELSDTWVNAGGKYGKLRVQVPPRLVAGQQGLELVIRRGHVASVPPRSEHRQKYVQFTLQPAGASGAGVTPTGPWSSDRLQALEQRQLFQVLRLAPTRRSNIPEQFTFAETGCPTASSDGDNAPAQLTSPPSGRDTAPFEEVEHWTSSASSDDGHQFPLLATPPLERDKAWEASDWSPPSESSEPELTAFEGWVWDAGNWELPTVLDLPTDSPPSTSLDPSDDSFETGSESGSVSTEQVRFIAQDS